MATGISDHTSQRPGFSQFLELSISKMESVSKYWVRRQKLAPHAAPLRPISVEHEAEAVGFHRSCRLDAMLPTEFHKLRQSPRAESDDPWETGSTLIQSKGEIAQARLFVTPYDCTEVVGQSTY